MCSVLSFSILLLHFRMLSKVLLRLFKVEILMMVVVVVCCKVVILYSNLAIS